MARSEYYGSVVENRNFLLPKFFRRKTFNLNKGPEIYFNAILFSYVVIDFSDAGLGCDTSTFLIFNVLKFY